MAASGPCCAMARSEHGHCSENWCGACLDRVCVQAQVTMVGHPGVTNFSLSSGIYCLLAVKRLSQT